MNKYPKRMKIFSPLTLLQKIVNNESIYISLIIMLGVLVVFFSFLSPYFFQQKNFVIIFRQQSITFILAAALTIVIVGGGIDLSIGSNMVFCSILAALSMKFFGNNFGILIGIVVAILGGVAVGLFNGYLIGRFNVNPWLVTLATLILVRGVAFVISRGRLIGNIPLSFTRFINGYFGPFPALVWIAIISGLIFHFLLSYTIYGSSVKGIGANPTAAEYCGISVNRYRLFVYGTSGFLASIAGLLIIGNIASTAPYISGGIEFYAITACVVGGTSFKGGIGTIAGTAIGTLIIGVILNGLTILGLSTPYLRLSRGLILVIVVIIDTYHDTMRKSRRQ